jgi:predicted nucleic acid-binding protein
VKPVYVLDASVVLKLAIDEPGSDEFRTWYAEHSADGVFAPVLLYSEVGRGLQKAQGASPKEHRTMHAMLLSTLDLVQNLDFAAWDLADRLTFYDAQYVELARTTRSVLVTGDARMAQAARRSGVKTLVFPAKLKKRASRHR